MDPQILSGFVDGVKAIVFIGGILLGVALFSLDFIISAFFVWGLLVAWVTGGLSELWRQITNSLSSILNMPPVSGKWLLGVGLSVLAAIGLLVLMIAILYLMLGRCQTCRREPR